MVKALALSFALLTVAAICASAEATEKLKADAESAGVAAAAATSDYDANWKAAKAYQKYGDGMEQQEVEGWKNLSKAAAKTGMKYGETAYKLKPQSVEGWYWYGQSVGTYSDCVSILTAIGEGLQGKTQKAFETAYSLDKSYDGYGPVLCLGRFWQVLPGIAGRDVKKSMRLFDEYLAAMGSSPTVDKNVYYYRGDLLREQGKKAEARADLQKAADLGSKPAAKLLAELK